MQLEDENRRLKELAADLALTPLPAPSPVRSAPDTCAVGRHHSGFPFSPLKQQIASCRLPIASGSDGGFARLQLIERGRMDQVPQSILRIGTNDSHDGLRSLADAQLRFVEQSIDDVPIAFDPVIHELRIAVASKHKEGRRFRHRHFGWELDISFLAIIERPKRTPGRSRRMLLA
jgi:hypothetical protein